LDGFGNRCTRILAPTGELTISTDLTLHDHGEPDVIAVGAEQHAIGNLPDDVLVYLLGSRYCETEHLMGMAWSLFGHEATGGRLVQAICDYVHKHVEFNYSHARPTKTAHDTFMEGRGVCRDFVHLAVTFCRCMNIPARYCAGYLSNIGLPPDPDPIDFAAWMEVYLGHRWHVFDPRHNQPRIGRVLMARGRDATDAALITNFGRCAQNGFEVITEED
jgi:transglutaminase-like putative cysteine protease